jgi:hypothetical protein
MLELHPTLVLRGKYSTFLLHAGSAQEPPKVILPMIKNNLNFAVIASTDYNLRT